MGIQQAAKISFEEKSAFSADLIENCWLVNAQSPLCSLIQTSAV